MKQLIILSTLAFALFACEKKADTATEKSPQAVKPAAEKPVAATPEAAQEATKEAASAAKVAADKVVAEADQAKVVVEKKAEAVKAIAAAPGASTAEAAAAAAKDDAATAAMGCGNMVEVEPETAKDSVKTAEAGPGCGNAGCGGCGGGEEVKPVVAGGTHYGSEFSLKDDATIALTKVMGAPDEYNGKNVRVSASVNKVCRAKGCWFVLQGEEGDKDFVRVTMNHKFFVPTDCQGKKAVVEGVFRKVELPESKVELTLIASAVELKS